MKKRIIAIVLMIVFALSMMACGGGEAVSVVDDNEKEFTETPGRTMQGPATVDVGDFIVDIPEGWLGILDLNWDTLEGDVPVEFETNAYTLLKGGQTSQDNNNDSPKVQIWYSDEDGAEILLGNIKSYMSEVTELDLKLEGKECTAVHTVLQMEGYEPDESDMVFIPLSENSCIRVIINVSSDGVQTGINIKDRDVLSILNSIEAK